MWGIEWRMHEDLPELPTPLWASPAQWLVSTMPLLRFCGTESFRKARA